MGDDARNNIAFERIKNFEERLTKSEQGINSIFDSYTIPDNITDYGRKLNYALAEIGDNKEEREKLKKRFSEAEKSLGESAQFVVEDFKNMIEEARISLDKMAEDIRREEELLKIDEEEKSANEEKIISLNEEIKKLNEERAEIAGPNGKGGKIADEKAKAVAIKKEQDKITKKIQEIEKEIAKIIEEKERITALMNAATTKEEMDKHVSEINKLEGNRLSLEKQKTDLSQEYQERDNEKRLIEENIRNLNLEYSNKESDIKARETEKAIIENNLRILPGRKPELDKLKSKYEDIKNDFETYSKETMQKLEDRGLQVDFDEEIKKDVNEATKTGEDEPIVSAPKFERPFQTPPTGAYIPNPEPIFDNNSLPIVSPAERKKQNFDYITGYANEGIGLTSEDRLNRIKSDLGGRDYEAMVKALNELSTSPIRLSRSEKKQLKNIMKEDKETLSNDIEDLSQEKLTELFEAVGINLDKSEMKSLKSSSFKSNDTAIDRMANRLTPDTNYGIVNGFGSMTGKEKTIWRDVISNYGKVKNDLSEEQRQDFEKYIITPIKFGTLQTEVDKACQGRIGRFFSKIGGEDAKIADIRSAIANVELSYGEETSSKSKAKNFTDSLKDQTVKYPPEPDMETKNEKGKEKSER